MPTTYTVTGSDSNLSSQHNNDYTDRSLRPGAGTNTQVEAGYWLGGGPWIRESNVQVELGLTNGQYTRATAETNIQVEGSVAFFPRWDDPRNNFNTINVPGVGDFAFQQNILAISADRNTQIEAGSHS